MWVINENPVIYSVVGDWHSGYVSGPMVIKEEGKYKAWYHAIYNGHFSIGYAESIDGENWNKRITPVLIPSVAQSETDIVEASVIKRNNTYYLWYNTFESAKENYKIGMATSSDGINWTKHPTPVLVGTNNWELAGVTDPSVIYHDGKFRMFYGGWGIPKTFRIGYAESNDGINWVKPSNQPLNLPSSGAPNGNGPNISFYDNQYHLFYHTGATGPIHIYHVASSDLQNWQCAEDTCSIIHADGTGFDSQMVTGPSVLNEGNRQLLYYGGSNGTIWQIGLAINQLSQPQPKIIIIPGLFGSWNKQAIVYKQSVPNSQWQLNPLATDYLGLFDTFTNLGLKENQDYYVFNYDWRKSLGEIVFDLSQFINTKGLINEDINIIGHSLGGLIARAYLQQYQNQNINKVITAGSPHQGVVQVYKALSAGEIEESNSLWWLAENLVLQLYRQGLETNKDIFQNNFPILHDLLATYPYLYNSQNKPISYDQYQFQNTYLQSLNNQLDSFLPKIYTLSGDKGNTVYGYQLGNRTWLDKLLGFYSEGRPVETIFKFGDNTVPLESASLANNQTLSMDHGEIIRKKGAIKKILDELKINYQEDQIVEGQAVDLFSSLFFLIMSNAKLEVEWQGQNYQGDQGLIHLSDYHNEPFKVRALGISPGNYKILIGYLRNSKSQWFWIKGTVPEQDPDSYFQEYTFSVINDELVLDKQFLAEFINEYANEHNLDWQQCRNYLQSNNLKKLQFCLLKFQHRLILSLNKLDPNNYAHLFLTLEYLENLYSQFNFPKSHAPNYKLLVKQFNHKTKIIATRQQSKHRNQEQGYLLNRINSRLENYNEIKLYSVKELLAQIK